MVSLESIYYQKDAKYSKLKYSKAKTNTILTEDFKDLNLVSTNASQYISPSIMRASSKNYLDHKDKGEDKYMESPSGDGQVEGLISLWMVDGTNILKKKYDISFYYDSQYQQS